MANVHYLHHPKDVEESLANPKAHWDDLEDRKARLQGVDTRLQAQSTFVVPPPRGATRPGLGQGGRRPKSLMKI